MQIFNNIASAVKFREYEKIFTGTNQEGGYDKPFLEYVADTTTIVLKPDNFTYFHYPDNTDSIPISTAELIENGAIPGLYPYEADRIYKKDADYKKYTYWGNSTQQQWGTWLCTWLSGNPLDFNTTPVWKDRFYLPGYVDLAGVYHYTAGSCVKDFDSVLTFDPGCYYRYFHIGNNFTNHLFTLLSGVTSENLYLDIENWRIDPTVNDLSNYNNSIAYENITEDTIRYNSLANTDLLSSSCLELNGIDQYANIFYDNQIDPYDTFTMNAWVYLDVENGLKGNQILGKGFRGGWNLRYNNGFFTPITFFYSQGGNCVICNDKNIIHNRQLPGNSPNIVGSQIDSDLFTWILDNGEYNNGKHLYKLDFDGNILDYKQFSSSYNFKFLALDSKNNPYVYETTTNSVCSFNTNTLDPISSVSYVYPNAKNMIIDRSDIVRLVDYDVYTLDSYDGVWALSGNKLFYSDNFASTFTISPYVSTLDLNDIVLDKNDELWAVDTNNIVYKISYIGHPVFSFTLDDSETNSNRKIDLTNEYDPIAKEYRDFIWVSDANKQKIYKCSTEGVLKEKMLLRPINFTPINKRMSNYEWHRYYNYINKDKKPTLQLETYFGTKAEPVSGKFIMDISDQIFENSEWHLFTISYNPSSGSFKYYLDAYQIYSMNFTPGTVLFFNYNNALCLGSNNGRYSLLGKELKNDNLYFKGKFGPINVYNKELTLSDVRHIYFSKFKFFDIEWTAHTKPRCYLEEIERFFKLKLPGSKSSFYNIEIVGMSSLNTDIKNQIETIIKDTAKKVSPAHCELLNIVWK